MTALPESVCWITGASSGIGEALAIAASERGARVILSARNEAELERVAGACASETLVLPLDVSQTDTFPAAVQAAEEKFGRVDILINNAGISQRSLAKDTDLDVYRQLMEVNFFGTVGLTRLVLPGMIERGQGHIAAVSSIAGKIGPPLRSGYAASKFAIQGYMESLMAETWNLGIRTTIASPGFVQTNVSKNALSSDGSPHGKLDPGIASGLPPEKCAAVILDAIAADKPEVWIGRQKWAVPFRHFLPALYRRVIRNVKTT